MGIREIRKSTNLTQQNVAESVGVKRSTVAMWENGSALPRAATLVRLSRLYDCTVDELLTTNALKDKGEKA